MLSYTFINSQCQVSNPGPEGPLVCYLYYELLVFSQYCSCALFGPRHKKTCLRGFAKNKGADQPAQRRSLISALVIH